MLKLKTAKELFQPKHGQLNIPALALILVFVVISAIVVHVGVWFFFHFLVGIEAKSDPHRVPIASATEPMPPNPQLQVNPKQDFRQYMQKENEWLNSYAWIDSQKQTTRIPIDRAMQIVVQQHLLEKENEKQNSNH
ncbi:MAG: hypothetical protein C5B54_09910 [Acidobacteria bacterium]|nr:MAG: hypothetical protein C5B54_09910 [Acidobacteriota bacterium]